MAGALGLLYAAYGSYYGFATRFAPQLPLISDGEYHLWLATAVLLAPACIFACHSVSDYWLGPFRAGLERVVRLSRRQALSGVFGLSVLVAVGYRTLRWILLRDHFITDDETMIRFGGQIMAMGQLSIQRSWPANTVTELYTISVGDRIFAMDWPGGLAFAALAYKSSLGPWLYAALAAATFWAVFAASHRLLGARAACVAGLLWLTSPMAWSLSITQHTHILSRACVSFVVLASVELISPVGESPKHRKLGWAALWGAAFGLSVTARPYETLSLLGPTLAYLGYLVVMQRGPRLGQCAIALATGLPPLLLYGVYNFLQTGNPFVTPRSLWASTELGLTATLIWKRLGLNVAHNLLMLGVWALGFVGLPLAYAGATNTSLPGRGLRAALMLGLVCQLGVALGHNNVGIHMVGPIHYSETMPVIALLAAAGLVSVARWLRPCLAKSGALTIATAGYLLCLVIAGSVYAGSLYNVGRVSDLLPRAVKQAQIHNAVVIAPPPLALSRKIRGGNGTWQLFHPPPHPQLTDDVIYVGDAIPVAQVASAFPSRGIFVATVNPESGQVQVTPAPIAGPRAP